LLGSLALDSEPVDDPLLSRTTSSAAPSATATATATPAHAGPPPGLAPVVPPAEVMWQYRDPSGQVQGPFSATMMHDWYLQQFFTPDLRVKRSSDADFESLEILIRRTGDSEQPFLAPKPAAPSSAFPSAPGTPQPGSAWGSGASTARAQTPLEQLTAAVAQGRFGGAGGGTGAAAPSPFYEPFGSNAGSPAVQGQSLPQSFGRSPLVQGAVDPWGAPLASNAGSPWNSSLGQQQHQQQQHQQQQIQQPVFAQQAPQPSVGGLHSPMDLLRQLAAQQHGIAAPHQQAFGQNPRLQQQQQQQQVTYDAFGRPSPVPSSPFFDPNQLAPGAQPGSSPSNWLAQQMPQNQAQMQQPQSQPWTSLRQNVDSQAGVASSPLAQFAQQPQAIAQPAAASPIGQAAPVQEPVQATNTQSSPWEDVKVEAVSLAQAPTPAAGAQQPEQALAVDSAPSPSLAPPVTTSIDQAPEPQAPTPAPKATSPAPAPWAKEEKKAAKPAAAAPSPSLREIQEAEAREAEKRKEVARAQAAQAAAEAAQRQAALDAQEAAESLPSSASWAAGPAQVPPTKAGSGAAPWTKPAAAPAPVAAKGQKTLKEIQEEEERQKKAAQAAREQQQAAVGLAAGRGYAGATSSAVSS
jgi:PERQ amino acid-rich with GYF domain-containing protein